MDKIVRLPPEWRQVGFDPTEASIGAEQDIS
jgi:hypothetical protein